MSERDDTGPDRGRRRRALRDPHHDWHDDDDALRTLDKSVIAIPLLDELLQEDDARAADVVQGLPAEPPRMRDVIIDLNLKYHRGRRGAREIVIEMIERLAAEGRGAVVATAKTALSEQYVFARLDGDAIRELVRRDNPRDQPPIEPRASASPALAGDDAAASNEGETPAEALAEARTTAQRAIFRVWPDFEVRRHVTKTISTVKADAARSAFAALGSDIVWAVIDSGVDATHRHFVRHKNLDVLPPLSHYDFSMPDGSTQTALTDDAGHGSHVAGIIAGEFVSTWQKDGDAPDDRAIAVSRHWDEAGGITFDTDRLQAVSGMAPKCKLVSFKVLDAKGKGLASNIIAAIAKIQELNANGRHLLIHGVNLSVGYEFEPEWFACGQSPLCVEVDRLVRSGVVVVVSSGNTGYGYQTTKYEGTVSAGMDLSINDPGNADLAITVGATHRDMPHTYGVSYFSSKGPTGDGRLKPDVVAPGEKIVSCAAGAPRARAKAQGGAADCEYVEQSGTSMAAPHVSGVIAAFLSVRREFIGQPEAVKQIFLSTATDLKRDRYFQGAGLVDLMRAIQSV